MKKIALLIVLLSFIACASPKEDCKINEKSTIDWVKSHSKPIACKKFGSNWETGYTIYTLIDSKNNIYNTGFTQLALPDTIK